MTSEHRNGLFAFFQQYPADLVAVLVATGGALVVGSDLLSVVDQFVGSNLSDVVDPLVGQLIVVPFMLSVPGYVFVAALFPESKTDDPGDITGPVPEERTLDRRARTLLSLLGSLVILSVVGSVLFVAEHLTFSSQVQAVCLVVVVGVVLATHRRFSIPVGQRFGTPLASLPEAVGTSLRGSLSDIVGPVTVLASVVLLLTAVSIGYALPRQAQEDPSTDFFLATESETGELAPEYPREMVVDEPHQLTFGVSNRENRPVNYTVLVGFHQITTGNNSTELLKRRPLGGFQKRVESGDTWERQHRVTPPVSGDDLRLTYLLYRGSPPEDPQPGDAYRVVHLRVNVTTGT
jgi:uncharacterized membrane protein